MTDFNEEASCYAVIPAAVRYDKRLPVGARLLYGEITSYMDAYRYCWAPDKNFAEAFGVDRNTVQRWLKALEEVGYIERGVKEMDYHFKRYIKVNKISTVFQVEKDEGHE